jgi:parallel beta-helix repeat protein
LFITASAPVVFGQGALTPPGAPAPTMKTLTQVEPRTPIPALPYVISSAGSYYLTSNLVSSTGAGITVAADHVTIDLRGFAVIGLGQFGGNYPAIFAPGPQVDLAVLNGSITLWSGEGVSAALTRNSKLEELRVSTIGRSALDIGDGSLVSECMVQSNCSYAVGVAPAIWTGNHCTVKACVAQANSGPGISTGKGSVVVSCVANSNMNYGIVTGDESKVADCAASLNAATGNGPGDGIFVGNGGAVSDCVASGNAYDGIDTMCGGSVLGCTVRTNLNHGIVVQYGSTVRDCTASSNHFNGIVVSLHSQVVGNTCDGNGNAGIYVGLAGDGNRIDGNSVTTNKVAGIDCSGSTADLVIRNSAHANGVNYSLNGAPGGTENATITVMPGANFMNPDPWGNFSY